MTKDRKTRETRMQVDIVEDAVYVEASRRIGDKYYKKIQKMPGADFVVGRGGYLVSVIYAKTYDPEEIAARMVIIRAEEEGVNPIDVTLEGNIARETRVEVLMALYWKARQRSVSASLRCKKAQDKARQSAERANCLWKKIEEEIRQEA